MQIKVKNPTYDIKDRYFYYVPKYHVFEGTIITNPSWVSSNNICIIADIPPKMRIIPKHLVLEIDNTIQETKIAKNKDVTVEVNGSKGAVYIVTKQNSKLTCTCPGFGFRKTCKHLKALDD